MSRDDGWLHVARYALIAVLVGVLVLVIDGVLDAGEQRAIDEVQRATGCAVREVPARECRPLTMPRPYDRRLLWLCCATGDGAGEETR